MYFNLQNIFSIIFQKFILIYFLMKIINLFISPLFQIILNLHRNYYLIYYLILLILDFLFMQVLKNYLYLMFDLVVMQIIPYLGL